MLPLEPCPVWMINVIFIPSSSSHDFRGDLCNSIFISALLRWENLTRWGDNWLQGIFITQNHFSWPGTILQTFSPPTPYTTVWVSTSVHQNHAVKIPPGWGPDLLTTLYLLVVLLWVGYILSIGERAKKTIISWGPDTARDLEAPGGIHIIKLF